MKHYLYAMKSEDQDPVNAGDMKSWFNFYKVENGETYVPTKRQEAAFLGEGDVLWFSMDTEIIGAAKVIRSIVDPMGSGVVEIWYDSHNIKKIGVTVNLAKEQPEGVVQEHIASSLQGFYDIMF
jgi:hypothetical protein